MNYRDLTGFQHSVNDVETAAGIHTLDLKRKANLAILERAPEHKQANAALGLLTDEETALIKGHIAQCRERCAFLENQVSDVLADDGLTDEEKIALIETVVW